MFLEGQFAPVLDERDDVDLSVSGTVPTQLQGSYVRNGPNPQFTPIGAYHLFDGDGMVHQVTFDEGRVSYRNRWVQSAGLMAERRAGRALFGGLSEFSFPDESVIAEVGMVKNTANTNIVGVGGRLLALMEAAPPIELDRSLATIGEWDFDGRLRGSMTAHPKFDPLTGETWFFGYSPFPPYLRLHVADAEGVLIRSHEIELPGPVMMHDFAVSESKVVIFDLPAVFDVEAMMTGGSAVSWRPSVGARIGVIDRTDPDAAIRWTEVEPFYVFHFLNAHDVGDSVVVEGCRADRLGIGFGSDEDPDGTSNLHLHQWTIDPVGGVTERALDDHVADFPRIADTVAGRAARYGYLATSSRHEDEVAFDSVMKFDLQQGTTTVHRYGNTTGDDAVFSGEAVFAPDVDGDAEDAGWLLNFVTDTGGHSDLVILDAGSMQEVAKVHLPRRVPFGFHGNWLPS